MYSTKPIKISSAPRILSQIQLITPVTYKLVIWISSISYKTKDNIRGCDYYNYLG